MGMAQTYWEFPSPAKGIPLDKLTSDYILDLAEGCLYPYSLPNLSSFSRRRRLPNV